MVTVLGKDYTIVKTKTCHNCGTKMEYAPRDIKLRDAVGGKTPTYINCPECNDELPVHVYPT